MAASTPIPMKTSKKSSNKNKNPQTLRLRRAMGRHLPPRMDTLWAPHAGARSPLLE